MDIEKQPLKSLEHLFSNSLSGEIPPIPLDRIKYGDVSAHYRNEMETMARLCRLQNPSKVLEFGTYHGFTTLVFAMNSAPDTQVYTLDLPLDQPIMTAFALEKYNASFIHWRAKVLYFKGTEYEAKIKTLYDDSARFDTTQLRNSIDLVLVDGNHQREYIENDTRKALELCSSRGIVVWHDYKTGWPDVTPFLNALAEERELVHLERTNYVVWMNEASHKRV